VAEAIHEAGASIDDPLSAGRFTVHRRMELMRTGLCSGGNAITAHHQVE
jgi:hypothetical protein